MIVKTRSPKQVAKILGIDPQTATRMFREGTLPGGKVGGRWMIADAKLIAYLQERNLLPADDPNINLDAMLALVD